MDFLEYIYYESLPYLYGAAGVWGLMNSDIDKLAGFAGLTLAFCSYKVFQLRYRNRTYTKKYKRQIRI